MKLKSILFTLFGSMLFFGCSNNENGSFEMMDESLVSPLPQTESSGQQRKLIKEGNVRFETNDMAATRKSIFESVEKYKAYVSSDQEYKSSSSIRNTIAIRVPAAHFDALLKDATKGVTKFDSKSIVIKDVTEEFLDVQARLKTKKELENRYLEIAKEAKNVTELLEVEKQLGLLRSEIESIEGRMNYLENQVSLATLTMGFYRTIPTQTQFGNKFANGFKNGWDNLIWFFVGLINIWPFLILVFGIVFWLVWRKPRKAQA
ncbi:DUF4349 domain-containing protein [Maribacter chungangensis]|uniref:DUF4349 domain-containing protein n=1 Tax=Maribacter chungangensis TaxID=1069117 RepID=A0ABW3B6B5_9FLAO